MSLLIQMIIEEKNLIENMISKYEEVLRALPKGTLVCKMVKGNPYQYLQYREGKKTVSEYVGRDPEKVEEVKSLIKRRKHINNMLKALREEYTLAQKILGEWTHGAVSRQRCHR